MRIEELTDPPDWLLNAKTYGANVEIIDGCVQWLSGEWIRGTFEAGRWYDGVFYNGVFKGDWNDGTFYGGVFEAKSCHSIDFKDGIWNTDCEPKTAINTAILWAKLQQIANQLKGLENA